MPPSSSSRKTCPRINAGNILHPSKFISFPLRNINSIDAYPDLIYRYAVFEIEYPTSDGRTEAKILFILYAPDVCHSKDKFVIATTKD